MKAVFHINKTSAEDCFLRVEGDLTVQNSVEFKSKLIELLDCAGSGTVEISLRDATAMDLSALQLLYAATQSLSKNKKTFSVIWPENESVETLITRTGFKPLLIFDSGI